GVLEVAESAVGEAAVQVGVAQVRVVADRLAVQAQGAFVVLVDQPQVALHQALLRGPRVADTTDAASQPRQDQRAPHGPAPSTRRYFEGRGYTRPRRRPQAESPAHEAAVHDQRLAGDVATGVAGQQQHRAD